VEPHARACDRGLAAGVARAYHDDIEGGVARGGPGLGTCLGPAATEKLVRQAGYSRFQRLDIRSLTNLFYSAQP